MTRPETEARVVDDAAARRRPLLPLLAARGLERLACEDTELYEALEREYRRQNETLALIAAASLADPSTLVCGGLGLGNVTTEGYPGHRFHAGCVHVDAIERMAIARAKAAFGARYANVQPHSGSTANQIVMFAVLMPGDGVLGLELSAGGHLTHGAPASISGRYFRATSYGVDAAGFIDYDGLASLARSTRPRLIVCGASAYPRRIDFAAFRRIADDVGAFVLADISHIAGLVVAGEHPSPIDHAHFTTTSTYKQLGGPRGGLVLMGRDADAPSPDGRGTLADLVQRAVFPLTQGTPNLDAVAAKARALGLAMAPGFRVVAQRTVRNARALAAAFASRGYRVLTGGTDNHLLLIDVRGRGLTGVVAERALEACDIVVNKNRIPGDPKPPHVASGIRLGANTLAIRGMEEDVMPLCADLVDEVLDAVRVVDDRQYELPSAVASAVRATVGALCRRFPIPGYPTVSPHAGD
jgi:glycine hydroxymethyltransferase